MERSERVLMDPGQIFRVFLESRISDSLDKKKKLKTIRLIFVGPLPPTLQFGMCSVLVAFFCHMKTRRSVKGREERFLRGKKYLGGVDLTTVVAKSNQASCVCGAGENLGFLYEGCWSLVISYYRLRTTLWSGTLACFLLGHVTDGEANSGNS